MTLQFACLHGHLLESESAKGRQHLVCPLCGSVTELKPGAGPAKPGSLDLTIVPVSMVDSSLAEMRSGGNTDAKAIDSTDAVLPTADVDQIAWDATCDEVGAKEPQQAEVKRVGQEQFRAPALPGYEVMEQLGQGGMGLVYLAYDEKHGREVALKTLQRMGPKDLVRFKQEFRALADIAHPNLASLYELLSDGRTWCFTMELLEGVEFIDYVWSEFDALTVDAGRALTAHPASDEPRLSRRRINRLYDAMKQLAIGLNELHRAGKLHSDIKPSNVLMTTEGRLVLLDFGLIAEISKDDEGRVSQVIQGTPQYMSPEQAACKPLTAASDWYAVGVMLYELLTGRLPIRDDSVRIMLRKQYETPIEPRQRQPNVPDELNDLCMALLDVNAQNRPGVVEVLRAVDAEDAAQQILETMIVPASRSVDLVGREQQLAELEQALAGVTAGSTRSVFVHGRSGMGKSALLRTFLDSVIEKKQAIVLEGRCYEQESVPFKALDSLIDELVNYLNTLPPQVVRGLLPQDSLPLIRLFPVLSQVPGAADAGKPTVDNADQHEVRQRALDGLRELLNRLDDRQPVVLYIDDLQWGDEDSSVLLADLVRPPGSPRLLLLGSYRREDGDTSPSLVTLREAYQRGQERPRWDDLPVDALSHQDAMQLALQLLGRADSASLRVADRIAQESGGSPFFVWELAQHVQEDASSLGSLELDEVIWTRARRLPEATRRLLEVFAVAGRPMRASEAYQAIDEVTHGPSLLAQLRTGNFVRTTELEADTVVETYHDRIRESVVNHLANARVRGHNLKIALVIEQASSLRVSDVEAQLSLTPGYEEPNVAFSLDKRQWQRIFDLAYFFDAAEKSARALPYALLAAEQASAQNALDVAEQQYEIAKRGANAADDARLFRVAEGLGDVLMTRGQYDRADHEFKTAQTLAKERVTRARIEGKRGFLCFKKGDMGNSKGHFERALTELGNPPPRHAVVQTAALMKEVGVQLLH